MQWDLKDFEGTDVRIGHSSAQTFLETFAFILAVDLWGQQNSPTAFLGDNLGALQEAVSMKGKGLHESLAQILAVLRCRRSLVLTVAHLYSEANTAADALSRLYAPEAEGKSWPFTATAYVKARKVRTLPDLVKLIR